MRNRKSEKLLFLGCAVIVGMNLPLFYLKGKLLKYVRKRYKRTVSYPLKSVQK